MPKQGHLTITLAEQIVRIAEQDAKSEDRSLANYVKHLILQEHRLKEKFEKIRQEDRN
jgi:hypothetical protein